MEKKYLEGNTLIKEDGSMTVVASDETIDRVGDSLKVDDWDLKEFKKNPVLVAGHNYKPEYIIGKAKNIRIEGSKLLFEPVFHDITELARNIAKMYREGFGKAWSVGFMPKQKEEGKNQLLEISAVAVPANPNALTMMMKSITNNEIKDIASWLIKMKKVIKKPKNKKLNKKVEKNEVVESISEDLELAEKRKKKWDNLNKIDSIMYSLYKVYIQNEIAVADFKKLVKETAELMIKVSEGADIKKEHKDKDFSGDIMDMVVMSIKAGRVLSGKNRKKIKEAVDITKEAISALETLLEDTVPSDTPKSVKEENSQKDKPKVEKKKGTVTSEELMRSILKTINKKSSFGLNQTSKRKKTNG